MNVKKLVTCFILMMVIIVGMNIFIIKKMFPAEDDSYIVELNRVEQLINEYEIGIRSGFIVQIYAVVGDLSVRSETAQ